MALVRTFALLLRILGNAVRHASRVLVRLYDVAIVLPLLAEHFIQAPRRPRPAKAGKAARAALDESDLERTHA